MLALLTLASTTGCTSYKVIASDREVVRVLKGASYTPQNDGWFVPDATWRDVNNALADKLPSK